MSDTPIYPRIPAHVTAREGSGSHSLIHGFRTIAQRDDWIQKAPHRRVPLSPFSPEVSAAWTTFAIVLHAVPDPRKVLR